MSNAEVVKTRENSKVLDMVYIAISAALIAICSWISIPTAVPFTLQTFAVFFVLLLLGGERGTIATLVYVLLGAVGVPVFAGFSGGIGILLGSTGGYIIGFLFVGLIYILFEKFFKKNIVMKIVALVLGLAVCYAFGTAWFMHVYIKSSGEVGLLTVLGWCVFPFIIPDLIKMALAVVVAKRIEPVIK
ncbi:MULTISPECIES: biotin transporter BioY [Butyrivibrio]|jgi:biotin transport system substrate-specific component|uniref:Biotin transporter n=1 Tax=Butyrivibrio proteoclasticus TaxID=43305 RepID=A0A1I5XC00_9FIRM|nr:MULTISPECIES: biotin transporter BioY [Butyrivibrio]MBE5839470.1 biotin transporter BioY [Butyrivibrio sp.]MBP3816773.1 biotin transporter BioY [Butyrivibrio sp.]SFQ29500.1 biotin transport system substrate-specific component [Butyrivibrio proteoclasticus]